jgi:enterochelin esterase-like enzyme
MMATDGTGEGDGPRVEGTRVVFSMPDPDRALAGVRLWQEVGLPADQLDFSYAAGRWRLAVERPAVTRMEYQFELAHPGGDRETVTDPGNPLLVGGAFGDKSVVEFPGYAPPDWLAAPAPPPGRQRKVALGRVAGRDGIVPPVTLWTPPGVRSDRALPLLLVHDGPEYVRLAAFTRYLATGVAGGWLPPLRAALLGPGGDRDRWYSADPDYAAALHDVVLPAVTARAATTARVGVGVSLGALAMLHAHRTYPGLVDALFLQSGSFFQPRYDAHEKRFPYYERIVEFVATVTADGVHAVLTCGAVEENLHNNRLMAATLRAPLHVTPDAHNYTSWRDALHPHLTGLLRGLAR